MQALSVCGVVTKKVPEMWHKMGVVARSRQRNGAGAIANLPFALAIPRRHRSTCSITRPGAREGTDRSRDDTGDFTLEPESSKLW